MHKKRWYYFVVIGLLLGSRMVNSQPLTESNQLFSLINERCQLMQSVAHYKYVHQLALFVPSVEHKILETVAQDAKSVGLPENEMQAAIQLQMRIGVTIQEQWVEKWRSGEKLPEQIIDLERKLRPTLKKLTHDIVLQTAKAKPSLADPQLREQLTDAIKQQIQAPLVTDEQKLALLGSLVDVAQS